MPLPCSKKMFINVQLNSLGNVCRRAIYWGFCCVQLIVLVHYSGVLSEKSLETNQQQWRDCNEGNLSNSSFLSNFHEFRSLLDLTFLSTVLFCIFYFLSLYLSPSLFLFIFLSFSLFLFSPSLSLSLSLSLSFSLSFCLSVCLYIFLSFFLFSSLYLSLSFFSPLSLSLSLSFCLYLWRCLLRFYGISSFVGDWMPNMFKFTYEIFMIFKCFFVDDL